MTNINGDSNAIITTNVVEVDTQGFEDTEIRNSNIMVAGVDSNYDVQVEDLEDLDITVAKKEYTITGDDIYIPQLYDDAPQWMKDLVGLVVDVSMTTNSTKLINDMNAMLQEFAVSYVPLNQYTQSILDLGNEDMRLNALIETLNSNFNNGLSKANAQIISLQMTKASKDEVVAQVIQTLSAQLANPDSNLGATVGRLDQAIVTEQTARARSFTTLTASLESTDGSIAANAKVLDHALAYVGINKAGASTNTGLSAYLEASNGVIGGADSQLANSIRVTAEGVESKWAYNSIVNINGVYRKSGFGLTTNNFSGNGTQANPYNSEFWIDATKLRFTNSNMTGSKAPFTIDASGATPQIKFNGVVEFSNVNGTATHRSGTSSPILGATTAVEGSTYYNTSTKSGYIVSNGSWINNSSVTDTSGLALKDMSNVTTIDGGKITTGSITASQIKAGTITADRLGPSTNNTTVWQGGGLVSQNFNGNSHGGIGSPSRGFRLSSNAAGTSTDPNIYGAYIKASYIESLYSPVPGTNNYGNFNYSAYAAGGSSVSVVGPTYGSGYNKNRVTSLTNSNLVVKGFADVSTGAVAAWDVKRYLQRSVDGGAYEDIQTKRMYFNLPLVRDMDTDSDHTDGGFVSIAIVIEIQPTMAMNTTLEFYFVEDLASIGNFNTISYRIPNGTTFVTINN